MTEYTPTTEQVENGYAHDSEDEYRDPVNYPASVRMRRRDFQRWLARFKAEAQVEALRDAADDWHEEHVGTRPVPYKWLHGRADRIAREAGIETGEK